MTRVPFPPGFLWGAATSAYQVEGSPLADGAGASIWDRFVHTPGAVAGGDTGDVACDHYRRYREDVALMRDLGLGAYRFSIAWSRVQPEGRGRPNPGGLDFYRRLVDALREAGITPMATLYHWDLPAALEDVGGWTNPDVAGRFADYAEICFCALDGVDLWATLNEPWVVVDHGYLLGIHAPGRRSAGDAARAARHLLRAHALGVEAYRAAATGPPAPGRGIGLVVNLEPKHPASDRVEDREAATRVDAYMNRQFLDPALLGSYPEELATVYGEAWSPDFEHEAAERATAIDWLGINYYSRSVVRSDPGAWAGAAPVPPAGVLRTELGWEVYPDGLEEVLRWVADRYGPRPLYVTESGAAFADPEAAAPGAEAVDDPLRVVYLRDHLRAVGRALEAGVDVRGYFVWSLLDNFEWAHGYSKRFGVVHVDFATQRRTHKASARFYADVIRTHGAAAVEG